MGEYKNYFYWKETLGKWYPEVAHDPHPSFFKSMIIEGKRELPEDVAKLSLDSLAKLFPREAGGGGQGKD
jgi:hypothetical protein